MKKIFLFLALALSAVFSKPTLVVLDPASIEIIYMLGGEKQILAISKMETSEIYPQEKTSKLKSVGTFSNPSLEKIVSLKPDIVILSSYSLNLEENLKKFGIKTLYLKANSIQEIAQNIKTIGDILEQEKQASELIKSYQSKIEKFQANPLKEKGVFIYSTSPLMVFPEGTLPDDVFRIIGIENIAKNLTGQRPIISQEYVLKQNPSIILYGLRVHAQDELTKSNPLLAKTNAMKNGQVFYINIASLLRGTPRIVDKIEKIYNEITIHQNP